MANKSNPRKDLNQFAFALMQKATGEIIPELIDEMKRAAQESGRRSGLKGGIARASKLTPERRSEIAKKAASTRWKSKQDEAEKNKPSFPPATKKHIGV